MFAQAIEDILQDQCTPAVVRAIEAGGSPLKLWQALQGAGFLELIAPEAAGGAGLALAELFPILSSFGRYTVPVPVAQTIVARALLGPSCAMPAGMITLAAALRREAGGAIVCPFTPCGQVADLVLAQDGDALLLLPAAAAQREASGVHGSLAATLRWPDDESAVTHVPGAGPLLPVFAAALHAALLSGAMTRVFEMTLQYCNDRIQFGKTLGKFQAVQHQLSVMAEHVAAASMAAEAAFYTDAAAPSLLAAAMAKSRTSEAAVLVASIAHALHGAIGVAEEYDLQLLTRRLHEWRIAHGSEAHWNVLIGNSVLAADVSIVDFVRSV
ncbi:MULTISPECIES: acyl-CoA dehydrogenase family protein [unclassified Polaromonas]|uniref:acyl-CoA dehydrogenase family protein n=1 Tax=unclassified Polaromonas TaxID=2638319 RepID=UPI000BBCDC10|nr:MULTISPECIES: acyl-CoA dehydrogenase family protein [unclassified Polaromonas]MDI1272588.1 acyl-CoA dehydrogenase family protein [Polaromonas sp.]